MKYNQYLQTSLLFLIAAFTAGHVLVRLPLLIACGIYAVMAALELKDKQ